MKVYIVTDGCYSDYRITRVYLDENKANEYCATLNSADAKVEEYETADERHLNLWEIVTSFASGDESFQNVTLAAVPPNKDTQTYFRYANGRQAVTLVRTVNRKPDKTMKARMMKAAQDIYWQCQNLRAQGRTVDEINKVLVDEI